MKHALVTFFAVMLVCGVLVAQETTPPPGTGSAQQPVPPAGQPSPTPSPSAGQPTPVPATGQPAPSSAPAQAGSAPAPGASNTRIAPGSVIPAQLAKTVDAKKAKKGDEVVAKVPQDLQATSGQVLLPKDTKIIGHVTDAQPRSKEQKESQLAIAFDRVDVKGGEQMQLPMSIQAIIAPPNRNPANAGNAGAGNEPAPTSPSAGTGAPTGAGARGGMGGNPSAYPSGAGNASAGNAPSVPQGSAEAARPQITGDTRGVVGIPDLNLSAASDAQGSVVTSEKKNVKLEDGTFLLLRVSPGTAQTPQPPQK
jgi:hypothetical protein